MKRYAQLAVAYACCRRCGPPDVAYESTTRPIHLLMLFGKPAIARQHKFSAGRAHCCKSGRIDQDLLPGSRSFPFLTVAENQDVGETKRLLGRGNVAPSKCEMMQEGECGVRYDDGRGSEDIGSGMGGVY